MKNKFKTEDVVLVYKNTPTFEEGTVAQIIDKDVNEDEYLVADLRDVGKADRDIGALLQYHAKWVKAENMRVVKFSKPAKYEYTLMLLFCFILGNLINHVLL